MTKVSNKNRHNDMTNLSIAHLGHKHVLSREGGVERVVFELSTRMASLGHDVTCYDRRSHHVSGKEFDEGKTDCHNGVHIRSVPTIEKKGLSALTSSFFASICTAFGRYDIVHYHAEGPCAMLWIPKLFGKRCIATIHGLDWQREKWKQGFASKYIRFGEWVAVKFADEIIVLSKEVQNYFKKVYGRDTVYIPNGVNRPVNKNANLIEEKYHITTDEYILFLGRLVPEKGVKYLIQAYQKLHTDKKLVIAGGSSDTDDYVKELKELASDNSNIIFTGFVQGDELDELYSNAYIYCLPYDLEGMPLSLLEAMSYGNCCVVSDIAECADVVEDKAIIFEKGNVDDLILKLQSLCDDQNLVEKYKCMSPNYICDKYSWDEVTKKTVELYKG